MDAYARHLRSGTRGVAALRRAARDEDNAADAPQAKPKRFLGGYAEGVTPVPIPNTEVKPLRADDTMIVRLWESRSLPD